MTSLYERLGGTYAVAGAVDILVDRLFLNAKVNANPEVALHHQVPANAPGYKFLVTAWSIKVAGGPDCYPGLDMVTAHEGLSINDEQFDAVAFEIEATLNFAGVPALERDEFMAIIESYRDEVVEVTVAEAAPVMA